MNKETIEEQVKQYEKEYTWFMEFKNCATGLGWDEGKQTIDCSKEWWNEHHAVKYGVIVHYSFSCFGMMCLANFFN